MRKDLKTKVIQKEAFNEKESQPYKRFGSNEPSSGLRKDDTRLR